MSRSSRAATRRIPKPRVHIEFAGDRNLPRSWLRGHISTGIKSRLLCLRRENDALRLGSFQVLHADECLLAIRRVSGEQSIAGLFNLSSVPVVWPQGLVRDGKELASVNGATVGQLPPFGALLIEERI